jgi:hypothetical protein
VATTKQTAPRSIEGSHLLSLSFPMLVYITSLMGIAHGVMPLVHSFLLAFYPQLSPIQSARRFVGVDLLTGIRGQGRR